MLRQLRFFLKNNLQSKNFLFVLLVQLIFSILAGVLFFVLLRKISAKSDEWQIRFQDSGLFSLESIQNGSVLIAVAVLLVMLLLGCGIQEFALILQNRRFRIGISWIFLLIQSAALILLELFFLIYHHSAFISFVALLGAILLWRGVQGFLLAALTLRFRLHSISIALFWSLIGALLISYPVFFFWMLVLFVVLYLIDRVGLFNLIDLFDLLDDWLDWSSWWDWSSLFDWKK